MHEDELAEIRDLCLAATPGPWVVSILDDDRAMSLVAVSTNGATEDATKWPDFDPSAIVAATLVQHPRYVDTGDERWDENAAFIAMARDAVPRLLDEVIRLRAMAQSGDADQA